MAHIAVDTRGNSIRLACEIFGVSQACYRYRPKNNADNEQIAQWLIRLTDNHCTRGFGLPPHPQAQRCTRPSSHSAMSRSRFSSQLSAGSRLLS